MRERIAGIVIGIGVLGALVPASPAAASDCSVRDPRIDNIVCDTVVEPVLGVVCVVLDKVKLDCFR